MRGFKSIFVSSKHKINCFLIQEKYFQTANAVDTLPLSPAFVVKTPAMLGWRPISEVMKIASFFRHELQDGSILVEDTMLMVN